MGENPLYRGKDLSMMDQSRTLSHDFRCPHVKEALINEGKVMEECLTRIGNTPKVCDRHEDSSQIYTTWLHLALNL
jgi:hypothetical protein